MNLEKLVSSFSLGIQPKAIKLNEPMCNYTSFRIGGPVDIFIVPQNIEELLYAIKVCVTNDIPYFILGNGSNILVRDKGYRGVVIQLYKNLQDVRFDGDFVYAQAGVLLSKLARLIAQQSLAGFEFASGIPGTLGGAVYMNAGAYGGEMKNVLVSADVVSSNGEFSTVTKDELHLDYRTSVLQESEDIVVGALLKLEKGKQRDILELTKDLNHRRKSKQPLEHPSAGSTFKRPKGFYAGKLIMDAGLKGYTIGDAQVSTKHCGFVINRGNATADDVIRLIRHIKNTVYHQFKVELETEVKIIGEE